MPSLSEELEEIRQLLKHKTEAQKRQAVLDYVHQYGVSERVTVLAEASMNINGEVENNVPDSLAWRTVLGQMQYDLEAELTQLDKYTTIADFGDGVDIDEVLNALDQSDKEKL
jgi:hypothetical protein